MNPAAPGVITVEYDPPGFRLVYPGHEPERFSDFASALKQVQIYQYLDRHPSNFGPAFQKACAEIDRKVRAGTASAADWVDVSERMHAIRQAIVANRQDFAGKVFEPDYEVALAKVPFADVDEVVDTAQTKGYEPTYKRVEKPSPEEVYEKDIEAAMKRYLERRREIMLTYARTSKSDREARVRREGRIARSRATLHDDERAALARYKIAVLEQAGVIT